ncbi:MAG TPA: hypothetical protein VFX47_07655 [Gammaproteobacteria bacterium]|nr:hypothetical protein [Gammaproteobacteria bacterium]
MKSNAVTSKAGLPGVGLILLLACFGFSTSSRASETCHTPTPQTLIDWYNTSHPEKLLRYSRRNSAIYHPIPVFKTDSPRINWIGLAWLSPVWGALFVADCNGKPLAAVSDGGVGKLGAGPTLPGVGQTVMVEYVDRETADCVHDSIGIMAFRNGRIVSLWKHDARQGMNAIGPGKAFHGFVSRNHTVNFDADGQAIHVTGKRAAFPYLEDGSQSAKPSASTILPTENYRWDAGKLRFMPQGKYRQFKSCVRIAWPRLK